MASEVGCQLPWNMGTVEGMPLCDNSTAFIKYDRYTNKLFFMAYSDMVQKTGCLLPCVFTEYKVSKIS